MTEPKAYIIEFLSDEWIRNCLLTLFLMAAYLLVGKRISAKYQLLMGVFISILLIITTITGHTRNIINGYWNISDNLPMHLCSVSNLIACFILFIPKNNRLFEFLYYIPDACLRIIKKY